MDFLQAYPGMLSQKFQGTRVADWLEPAGAFPPLLRGRVLLFVSSLPWETRLPPGVGVLLVPWGAADHSPLLPTNADRVLCEAHGSSRRSQGRSS